MEIARTKLVFPGYISSFRWVSTERLWLDENRKLLLVILPNKGQLVRHLLASLTLLQIEYLTNHMNHKENTVICFFGDSDFKYKGGYAPRFVIYDDIRVERFVVQRDGGYFSRLTSLGLIPEILDIDLKKPKPNKDRGRNLFVQGKTAYEVYVD